MKGKTKRREKTIRVWTLNQATAAVPYISSIVRSLRENWQEVAANTQLIARLDNQPGRPTRDQLIAKQEAQKELREAQSRFEDAQAELAALDVYCLEPNHGLALVPFAYENELAWFIFDLFDSEPFRYWRFHTDPLDTRRTVTDVVGKLDAMFRAT
jgi:hypothetical protein